MASQLMAKAIEELERSRSMNGVSGLTQQEENVLALLQDSGSGPGQPVSVQSLLQERAPRSSEQQLFAVLKSLELKGLLITDAAETGYELTKAGYLRP
jgi:Fe2+ or Zn2+ uptake regulation protein